MPLLFIVAAFKNYNLTLPAVAIVPHESHAVVPSIAELRCSAKQPSQPWQDIGRIKSWVIRNRGTIHYQFYHSMIQRTSVSNTIKCYVARNVR